MHILVLNGSPKGDYSITLQTVKFLEKKFPEDAFEVLHVGQKIKSLTKDFSKASDAIARADVLLFSYPVYTFIAPCQLHKFIELMKTHGMDVTGKIATQITTSKHFYDITAHRYIQDNCADLGLNFIRGLSADMDDLLSEKGRTEAENFWKSFEWQAEKGYFEPVPAPRAPYVGVPATACEAEGEKKGDVVIIADLKPEDAQLQAMVDRFRAKLPYATRVVNIREYPFRGGCLGCFNCAVSGKCVYKDGFDDYLRGTIQTGEAIVYAFSVKDHSMGSLFKTYDDRQFCNGHRTVTIGMPVGYLIRGNLTREENVRTIIEGRANVGNNILSGVATDEHILFRLHPLAALPLSKDTHVDCAAADNEHTVALNTLCRGVSLGFLGVLHVIATVQHREYSTVNAHYTVAIHPLSTIGTIHKRNAGIAHICVSAALNTRGRGIIGFFGREYRAAACLHIQIAVHKIYGTL